MVEVGRSYKHYKSGKVYIVIALAQMECTLEEVVVYQLRNETPETTATNGPEVWVRPLKEFEEVLKVPRFDEVYPVEPQQKPLFNCLSAFAAVEIAENQERVVGGGF